LSLGNIDPGATGAPGPSGKFGGMQPIKTTLPGTAEFAKKPTDILAAVRPFFIQ